MPRPRTTVACGQCGHTRWLNWGIKRKNHVATGWVIYCGYCTWLPGRFEPTKAEAYDAWTAMQVARQLEGR